MPPSPRPALQKAQETLPSPNVDRIRYDADQRVLNLYDLPNSDRWMVRLPNEAHGQPVGPQHRLPAGVDTSRTMVYYTRPGVRVSMAVSVAEIEAYQEGLVPSFAANP